MDLATLKKAEKYVNRSILELSKVVEEEVTKYTGKLVFGAWNESGGLISTSVWVRSTEDKFKSNVPKRIIINPGWRILIVEFDESGNKVNRKIYNESFIYTKRVYNTCLCIGKLDNTVITIDDAAKQVLIADTSTNYQSKLFSKKWIIKGDSISDIQYLTGIKKYYEYISEDTGIIVDAYGGAGSGYAREKTNKDSTKVTNGIFHEGIEELPDKCDIFTLFGGTNDWKCDNVNYPLGNIGDTGLTTITGFIKQCFENVRSKYANGDTLITVFTPLPRAECYPLIDKSGEVTTKPHGYTLGELSYRIMELSELYNFKCLDLYHLARCYCYNDVFRQKYMYDTVHYNSKGNELFAKDIKGFLESLF